MKRFALGLLAAICLPVAAVHLALILSHPDLDGRIRARGLTGEVSIERDALGVPTISAHGRADLAFGTGFVHAQDRFFQMDLSRRVAAGELAELVGPAVLEQDRQARLFRFRTLAERTLRTLPEAQREVLAAYARGVNAGLAKLEARPWEYLLIGAPPAAWREEDTLLAAYSMWWDLQFSGFRRERVRRLLDERLSGPRCEDGWKCATRFFYPPRTSWDAPNSARSLDGMAPPFEPVPIPGPDVLDLRAMPSAWGTTAPAAARRADEPDAARILAEPTAGAGSNNWAVIGPLSSSGGALVANDMHLYGRVPAVWYRARLVLRAAPAMDAPGGAPPARAAAGATPRAVRPLPEDDGEEADAPELDVTGVTLPGAPVVVAGSNRRIAWGFTNSYGDWLSLESEPCDATSIEQVPAVQERIRVKGGAAVALAVRSDARGVLLRFDAARGRCEFARWVALDPAYTNLALLELERARSVSAALALAPRIGIPHQNLIVGDSAGHIGWTILGVIPPERAAKHPAILDPPIGRLWSANALATDDAAAQRAIGGWDPLESTCRHASLSIL